MKRSTAALLLTGLLSLPFACRPHRTASAGCYKGKLVVKGICANYTIQVLEGGIDTALIVRQWHDEQGGKSFRNVFALGSPCTFPGTIREGDEFWFRIDSSVVQNCMQCMAYYPTPDKKLRITVLNAPCTP